ncbi:MAG: acyltransferase [Casimicrobium sp.]
MLAGDGDIRIGDGCVLNEQVIVTSSLRVTIGANCMLAPRVYILDVDHEFCSREIPIVLQGYSSSEVIIDDDVWIGTQVVITKGVKVGRGAIIAANSVVTRDVLPFQIVGGAPARVLKDRPK